MPSIPPTRAPLARLQRAINTGQLPPEFASKFAQGIEEFARAEEGSRVTSTPFAPRAEFHPLGAPGTLNYQKLRSMLDGAQEEVVTEGLQLKMGTDADRSPTPAPPSLRDHIEAAVAATTTGETL